MLDGFYVSVLNTVFFFSIPCSLNILITFKKYSMFQICFRYTTKLSRRDRISHLPLTCTHALSPPLSTSSIRVGGACSTDETMLTDYNQPKSIVTLCFILCFVYFSGLDKSITACVQLYSVVQSRFTTLNILWTLPFHPSLPSTLGIY